MIKFTKYSSFLLFFFLSGLQTVQAQLTVTGGNVITMTPQEFIQTYLVGTGVTISNATFNGSSAPINTIQTVPNSIENQQIGNFTTSGTTRNELTFAGGVILSSGKATDTPDPPVFASTAMNGPTGDPDLAKIAGTTSANVLDQTILEFDFVPQTDVLNFRYIFGSEEFDAYCNAQYNDAFGFFLSGPGISGGMGYTNDAVNIALLPNSNNPVTIHNICANKPLYSWWNDPSNPKRDISYNRYTYVFTATYSVTCQQTYHIKLALCDVGDRIYDSGVFLEQNSFSSNDITINTSFSNPLGGQNAIVNCSNAILQFQLPNPVTTDYVIDLAIDPGSTAPQSDFLPNPLPTSVTIPAGQSQSPPLIITPINISQPGGMETLILRASHTICGNTSSTQVSIVFKDKPPLVVTVIPPPPGLICDGSMVSLSATVAGGYPAYAYSWPGGVTTNPANVIASAGSPVVTVMVTDICADTTYASTTLSITTLPGQAGPVSGPSAICQPLYSVPYHIDPVTGANGYVWRTPAGVPAPANPSPNDVTLDFGPGAASGNIIVYGVNQCGQGTSSTLPVVLYPRPVPSLQASQTSTCVGIPVTYTTDAGMSAYTWTYTTANATLVSGGSSTDNTMTLNWTTGGTGQVTVNYSDVNHCQAVTPTQLTISVSSLPIPTISGSQELCAGSTGVIYTTESGMSNYNWTVSPGNTVIPAGNTCSVSWNSSGAQWIRVVYQDPATGCSSSPSNPGLSVTIHALPLPGLNGPVAGCQGIQLGPFTTEPGMSGYLWNPVGGTLLQGSGPQEVFITWNTSGTKQVLVSYTDIHGCQGTSVPFAVTVNPTPVVTFTPPAGTYCPNTPAFPLTNGLPSGGSYSGPGVTSNADVFYFNPAQANIGSNTIIYSYTSGAGCQASASGNFIINPLPDVIFTPSHPDLRWCSADPVIINLGSTVPGAVFNWTASANATINPSSITNGSGNISQAFTNSGGNVEPVLFEVTATAGGCVSGQFPYTIQVNPVATVSASPVSQVICSQTSGSTVSLTSVPAAGVSYSWTFAGPADISPAGGSGSSNPVPSVTFTNSGTVQETVTYTVNTTFDNCPGSSAQFTVEVNPKPSLANSPLSQGVCLGSSSTRVDFTSSVAYATSYQWFATASPASITGYTTGSQTIPYLPVQTLTDPSNSAGTVTYAITPSISLNSVTCYGAVTSYIIQTNPLPTPNIQNVQPVCEFTQGMTYSTASVAGHNYSWTVSGGTITSASNLPAITVDWGSSGSGTLTVVESTASTNPVCQATDSKTLSILSRPSPTITVDYSLSNGICLQMTGHYQSQAGMTNYIWTISPGGTILSQSAGNLAVQWITTGAKTVSVNYNLADGCPGLVPGSVSFNVNPLPDVTLSGPLPAVACQGLTSAFSVPSDPNSGFTWSLVPPTAGILTSPQGQPSAVYSWSAPAPAAVVSVTGLNNFGCSALNQVSFTVNPRPNVTFTSCFDPVTIPAAKPFILRGGVPIGTGGIYSGEGVSLNGNAYEFEPSSVSGPFPKTVIITYNYTNTYGCPSADTKSIQVVSSPVFQCGNAMMPLRDVRTTPNRTYSTVWRGNRCWMTQDLDYGTALTTQSPQTDNCQPEKFCPLGDPACVLSGGFYQWDELMQYNTPEGMQGLCPPGWHIPSMAEWQMLIDDPSNSGNGLAGGYLKDVPFSATLYGMLYLNTAWEFLQGNSLSATMYWTSTMNGSATAFARGMNSFCPSVSLYSSSRANAFQVRCIKD